MLIGRVNNLEIPNESYFNQLIYYLSEYLEKLEIQNEQFSEKANEKAKICLRWLFFPNKEFERDFDCIENDIGKKTRMMVRNYTRSVLQLLGQIAECIVIDRCTNDLNTNIKCINMATYRENIYMQYPNINYSAYVPFSPSIQYIFLKDEDGFLNRYKVPDYNPQHTSKDIAWCSRDNILNQLKARIDEMGYLENAKLQIKTSINCPDLDSESYIATPILFFDLKNNIEELRKKYPKHIIFSSREVDEYMHLEIDKYFRILMAYVTGMIDTLEYSSINIEKDDYLSYLFRTPIDALLQEKKVDLSGVIEMLDAHRKPVRIGV